MKNQFLFLFLLLSLISCVDEAQTKINTFHVQKEGTIWKAKTIKATVSPDGNLTIEANYNNEIITLTTSSITPQTYLLGLSTIEMATFEIKESSGIKTYSTGNKIGLGEIVIKEYDAVSNTISGTFKFTPENVFSTSIGEILDFNSGTFYKIPVIAVNSVVSTVIVCDGDSRTDGYTGTTFYKYSDYLYLNKSFQIYNTASGGATLTDNEIEKVCWITKDAINVITPKYNTQAKNNIVCIYADYNDLSVREKSAQETFSELQSYCEARKKEGWKVIIVTEPNHNNVGGEAKRLVLNNLIRTQSSTFCDGIADVETNKYIGLANTYLDTTFFFDGVHMTAAGYKHVGFLVRNEIYKIVSSTKR